MAEPLDNVRAGMTGRHEVVVTRELTVGAHVEGMPSVFGAPMMTPRNGNRFRGGCGAALACGLGPSAAKSNVRHLAPTPVGRMVVATAQVLKVSGRSMLRAVEAHDGVRKIGEGTHRRGAVNLETFVKRLAAD